MRPIDVVRKVAPNAKPAYLEAFENGDKYFQEAEITTPVRLAHFLAQTCEETGGYTIFVESGNYSAARIRVVWPSRPEAVQYAHNPEALFNSVYANRMGNGSPSSGDGFKFRGRGILQTTGRAAYRKYGQRLGIDLEDNPALIYDPRYILQPALFEWVESGCNEVADRKNSDDANVKAITLKVNGGYTNLDQRQAWFRKIKPLIDKVDLQLSTVPATEDKAMSTLIPFAAINEFLVSIEKFSGTAQVAGPIIGNFFPAKFRPLFSELDEIKPGLRMLQLLSKLEEARETLDGDAETVAMIKAAEDWIAMLRASLPQATRDVAAQASGR